MFRYAEKTERKEYQGVRDIDLGLGWVAEKGSKIEVMGFDGGT